MSAIDGFVSEPRPAVHFGVGAIDHLPGVVRATGAGQVVVVTDDALASTSVIATVRAVLADAGIPACLFAGVHAIPTTDDVAAGAAAVTATAADAAAFASAAAVSAAVTATLKASAPTTPAAPHARSAPSASRIALVAVGAGAAIDAAKGIAIAAVNPQRGRDLDLREVFAVPALPIVAVPTTAGAGAEANAFGVVTDPAAHRQFCLGHASSMPAAAILDPVLTVGLPPAVTAATGLDALTRALDSYLSPRANPWSDGIALQAIRMIAASLPLACADGTDLAARSQMLLAAHMAGVAVANTGLGLCHVIAQSLGGRWDIAPGVALTMLLPDVLRFNLPVRTGRLADVAFALGVGDTRADTGRNAAAAIDAVAALREQVGLTGLADGLGITEADFAQIAADALDNEVLADTPRQPTGDDIGALLSGSPPGAP
jgi:alcohol dehydrogenase